MRVVTVVLAVVLSVVWSVQAQTTPPPKPPQADTCVECHGPNGNAVIPQNPSLAGQTWRYIYLQLRTSRKAGARIRR